MANDATQASVGCRTQNDDGRKASHICAQHPYTEPCLDDSQRYVLPHRPGTMCFRNARNPQHGPIQIFSSVFWVKRAHETATNARAHLPAQRSAPNLTSNATPCASACAMLRCLKKRVRETRGSNGVALRALQSSLWQRFLQPAHPTSPALLSCVFHRFTSHYFFFNVCFSVEERTNLHSDPPLFTNFVFPCRVPQMS
ncbi:hypothetical protein DM02DRAFT_270358 [Periconia macrospinosa]|uniref:Uncharacterized protein n=1 Tax=Periconia macrospinosa TaxID=97972 RepID=A0A2V1D3J5_9PLEO|nr:hypothetical protein DM02DRAFT_270358 [Periconia macrospinosa]